ncbi:hypothetical protein [Ulvibacterium sp.]|uniref:DUF7009 family protein n=1 Tax=Ulvibacterium sp. TaxID=2665914 RepID=UPI0026295FF5|nr:hypothetical protein [Ulvibacterium sp.]
MKIRIRGNSVRFRLTKSEVSELCRAGYFEEKTEFDTSEFTYAIKASAVHENLFVSFNGNRILLYIPNILLMDWDTTDRVGFYHNQSLQRGNMLKLTLEKDFMCMDETTEDQSDNYPNPKAGTL